MSNGMVFSWAENAEGRMVHVDDVPRGISCGCKCPYCHERLLARHGAEREHGFAHHSENRGANLKICYMVTLYKLAEQIVQTKKRIHAPSYYGIFKESDMDFVSVKTDSSYEREDKQPDVIATTKDGRQYLIEFVLRYKVQHKQAIDYKSLTCLEIDLSNQTLETVEDFLLSSSEDRKWLNNEDYFGRIEKRYKDAGKQIHIVDEGECNRCELQYSCCAVRLHGFSAIENNGRRYRLCKTELFNKTLQERKLEEERQRMAWQEWKEKERVERVKRMNIHNEHLQQEYKPQPENIKIQREIPQTPSGEISCFNCQANLAWANCGDGYAHCGCYRSIGVPKCTPPDCAKKCRNFRPKS